MKSIILGIAISCVTSVSVLKSQDTIQYVWYEDFEQLNNDSMQSGPMVKRWQPSCSFYIEESNTIENVGGIYGKVWQSIYHKGRYAGGNDDGFSLDIPVGGQYDELWFDNDMFVDPDFNGTSPNGGYSGKILNGFFGGNDVIRGGANTEIWDLDSSMYTGNGWTAHGIWGSGYPNSMRPYFYDQLDDGQTHQIQIGSTVNRGYWLHISRRVKLNTPGKSDGIFEVYFDGVLIGQEKNIMWNSWAEAHNDIYPNGIGKIDGLHLCFFAGGGGTTYASPRDNFIYLDNLCVYYYKKSAKSYLSGPAPAKHRIPIVRKKGHKYAPDLLVDEVFQNGTDTIYSHVNTMVYSPYSLKGDVQKKEIKLTEGPIKIKFLRFYPGVDNWEGYNSWTKVYSGTGSNKTLLYVFDRGNYPDMKNYYTIDNNTATIEYYSGSNLSEGFIATYTNGTNVVVEEPKPEPEPETPVEEPEVNNAPVIENQTFIIKESDFKNQLVGKIVAYDKDDGQTLSYEIIDGNTQGLFEIGGSTGKLTTSTSQLFSMDIATYTITIRVSDDADEAKSNDATVTVKFVGNTQNVYIDPNNADDLYEDGTQMHPYDSWNDVRWVTGNNYFQKRGTVSNEAHIVIGANNVNLGAYGTGELPVLSSETNAYIISAFEKSGVSINNLSVKGPNATSCIYFLGDQCDNVTISHCAFEGSSNAIRIIDGKKFIIKYNEISSCEEGIYSTSANNEIYYNLFKNNNSSISLTTNNSFASIFNNVFYSNENAISTSYAEMTIYNNIFYFSHDNQTAIETKTNKVNSDYNIFYPEHAGFIKLSSKLYSNLVDLRSALNFDTHSSNLDPKFKDILTDDFSIFNNSPAVNAGISLNIEYDFFGVKVPYSGATDIGISEVKSAGIGQSGAEQSNTQMMVYPNPSSGEVNVNVTTTNPVNESSNIRLVDALGRTVLTKLVEQVADEILETIDLSSLTNGQYFLVFQNASDIITKKIILQKE
jgi:hypothetical protein